MLRKDRRVFGKTVLLIIKVRNLNKRAVFVFIQPDRYEKLFKAPDHKLAYFQRFA